MPSWGEILNEVRGRPQDLDAIRRGYLKDLSEETDRNVIAYYSGWLEKLDADEHSLIGDWDKLGFMATIKGLDKKKGLDLILHTPGGVFEATESIVEYLKSIFGNDIRAIVPQIAMSAGTMIACACKTIIMGKHSNLGPIDPQYRGMACHGIIEEFEKARKEIIANLKVAPYWNILLSKYPASIVGACEVAIESSKESVTEWLQDNMFSKYGKKEAKEKATCAVKKLMPPSTRPHGKHLHKEFFKDLGFEIMDLESDPDLQEKVLSVHHSFSITISQTPTVKIIENHKGEAFIKQKQQMSISVPRPQS